MKTSTLSDILHQRCPRCRMGAMFRGSIFRGFPRMNERCPVCDLKFEREEGYFLGAMYISYALAVAVIGTFTAAIWAASKWWITSATIWGVVLFIPLVPTITLFSRVLWIYLDQRMDPEKR